MRGHAKPLWNRHLLCIHILSVIMMLHVRSILTLQMFCLPSNYFFITKHNVVSLHALTRLFPDEWQGNEIRALQNCVCFTL